jgi:hypothetical protein
MLGAHNDVGARCPRHYSERMLTRCPACQGLTAEYRNLRIEGEPDAQKK